jgi:rod shape determining protein RodA
VNNERSLLKAVNIPLLVIVGVLLVYGTVVIRSATFGMDAASGMLKRHVLGIALGLVLMLIAWVIDYRKLQAWIGPLLALDAFLILMPRIPGIGAAAKGATSWVQIAGFRLFQPSEPAKLVTIVVMAAVIAQYKGKIERPIDVAKIVGIMLIPLGLILLQPDLGTGLVFVAITMGMLLVGGLKGRYFLAFALVAVLLTGTVFKLHLLEQYQEDRLMVFVDPARDPQGAGYNLEQSKIAIGSGELAGKGLKQGSQGNLNFLPERHTDFIFSVLGEELGFLGGVLLLGLYFGLMLTSLEIAASSRDLFGTLIVVGVMSMWLFQVLENMGMTIGLMPITGIPLPFMSYGSSFLVTNLAATGMLLSVWTRRIVA